MMELLILLLWDDDKHIENALKKYFSFQLTYN